MFRRDFMPSAHNGALEKRVAAQVLFCSILYLLLMTLAPLGRALSSCVPLAVRLRPDQRIVQNV